MSAIFWAQGSDSERMEDSSPTREEGELGPSEAGMLQSILSMPYVPTRRKEPSQPPTQLTPTVNGLICPQASSLGEDMKREKKQAGKGGSFCPGFLSGAEVTKWPTGLRTHVQEAGACSWPQVLTKLTMSQSCTRP